MSLNRADLLALLPLSLLAVATGFATSLWPAVLGILVVLALAAVIGRRVRIDTLGQMALSLLAIGTATVVTASVVPGLAAKRALTLGPAWTFLALTGLMLCLPRLFYARPVGGVRTTAAFGLLTLLALGGCPGYPGESLIGFLTGQHRGTSTTTRPYLELVVLYGVLQIAALMASDSAWSDVLRQPRVLRRAIVLSVVLGTAAVALATPLGIALPFAHDWAVKKLLSDGSTTRSGFSDFMELGSMSGMLESDTVALRISGLPAPYLRGIVYSHYGHRSWVAPPSGSSPPVTLPSTSEEAGPERVLIEYQSDEEPRLFLPLGATITSATPAEVQADRFGVFQATHQPMERLAFTITDIDIDSAALPKVRPARPTVDDLVVPGPLADDLRRIAYSWVGDVESDRGRVDALLDHFARHFQYSLEVERPTEPDPVLHFLESDQRGHCEYFASAMTLLSRALGVPARLAAGYLVSEQNPITGEWLARERDGHAWTEVWLDNAWRTVDATPGGADGPREGMGPIDALFDAVGVWIGRAWQGVQAIPLWAFLGAGGVLIGSLLAFQWVRRRNASHVLAGAPPELRALLGALSARGLERDLSESLEAFAIRLRASGDADTAALIDAYAAARYGGQDAAAALSALDSQRRRLGAQTTP